MIQVKMNSLHPSYYCEVSRVQTELWKSKIPSNFVIDCGYNKELEILGGGYKPDRKPEVPL